MKLFDIVVTPYGIGEIVDIEHYNRLDGGTNRYGVKLENNPFSYSPVYFWPKELQSFKEN